jgi:GntR family transcriptional regulator
MVAVGISKTHRLYLLLKEGIVSRRRPADRPLPGEMALAKAHKLSRVTVRRALDGLQHDGLIRRQPGPGTFILDTAAPRAMVGDLSDTLARLVAMGRAYVLENGAVAMTGSAADLKSNADLARTYLGM